ncbi:manganese efflux pump MntP family protein [Saccharopolyspora flava]|uniref:Putative Mn2+ efflux pump MntP n=1 Tax=Saccharopolyspora flava TaxID=95161 RepID=A0A1I6TNZ4_9PSEU|nr:manganese efflux pump [Saccharopolyspora flava]SFS90959.1 Putative Mn2+ efflux pump MntP [Saccharopolyspora flava]
MFEIIALGFFLSLDNFRSSIAIGTIPFTFRRAVQIALVFGIWDTVAPLIGGVLGRFIGEATGEVADYLGPVLLGVYGLYLLIGAIRHPEPDEIDQPWVTLFGIPLALSVDNLLAGTGLGILGFSPVLAALLFGAITAVMSLAGMCLGRYAARLIPVRADLLSGISLVTAAIVLPFVTS